MIDQIAIWGTKLPFKCNCKQNLSYFRHTVICGHERLFEFENPVQSKFIKLLKLS